jgi:putative PIN family toxin of toxin-antitoxin system
VLSGGNRVVLDTNIVVSAALSTQGSPAKIFELLLSNKICNYTSNEIYDEIEGVLRRPKIVKNLSLDFVQFMENYFREKSIFVSPVSLTAHPVRDEDDKKFLECALKAKANIVSGDADLLDISSFKGIKILSANEFLQLHSSSQ